MELEQSRRPVHQIRSSLMASVVQSSNGRAASRGDEMKLGGDEPSTKCLLLGSSSLVNSGLC